MSPLRFPRPTHQCPFQDVKMVNLRWWKIHFERSGPKKNAVFGSTSSFLQLILRSFDCLKKLVQSTFGKKIKPSKRHPFSNIQWKVIALHLLFVIAWCMSRKGGQSLILPNQFVWFMAHHSTAACNTSYAASQKPVFWQFSKQFKFWSKNTSFGFWDALGHFLEVSL